MGIEVQGDAEHQWQYLDREKIEDLGLDWYDLKARGYESVLGRFHSVDSDLTNQESYSTYQYGWNNPILRSDPNGLNPCCEGVVDFIKGAVDAVLEDNIPVATSYVNPKGSSEYHLGAKAGHVLSMIGATAEIITGIGGDAAAAVGEVVTVGAATPVAVPLATGSTAMILHGGSTFAKAAYNLNSEGKSNSRAGKPFTPKEKQKVIDANKNQNEGKVICEGCGVETTSPSKSQKGVSPPKTDRQIDHIKPKSKGGSGTADNGQVLCRDCNRKKSDN